MKYLENHSSNLGIWSFEGPSVHLCEKNVFLYLVEIRGVLLFVLILRRGYYAMAKRWGSYGTAQGLFGM